MKMKFKAKVAKVTARWFMNLNLMQDIKIHGVFCRVIVEVEGMNMDFVTSQHQDNYYRIKGNL